MKYECETAHSAGADKPGSPAADSTKAGPVHSSQDQINYLWKISIIGAIGTILFAFLGLLGYIPGLSFLGAVHESFIPMAPSTAVSFVILGACLLGIILRPRRRVILKLLGFLVVSVSLFGVLEVVGHFTGTSLNFEDALVPNAGYLGAIPLARMSPATGAVFFLAGFAIFILALWSSTGDRRTHLGHWAGSAGSAVLVIGFVFCGAYIYGTPLLYGHGATVPMALTTALGFLMLGSSIVGASGIDAIPIKILAGRSTYSYLLRFFLPLTTFSVLFGGFMAHYASTLFQLNMAIMQAIVTVLVVLITAYLTMRLARHLGDSIDQAEEALQVSEEKFKTYILSAPDAIFVVDAVGRYIEVNEAACRLTGYTESELMRMFIPDIIDPQTSTQVLESLDIFKKTGSLSTEFRLKRKNGSVIWVSLEAVSLSAGRSMAFCSDITERKQAEEALREGEARMSKAELISRIGHWDWNLISKDLTWSQGLCTLFGIDESRFGGKYESFLDFVHPDDRQHVMECVDKAINGVQPLDHEHRIIRPDGTVRLIHATAEITFEHGKATRMLGVARDITERRQAEEALRRSALELKAIYENAPLVMLLVDHERRIVKLNALAASLARRPADEIIGLRAGAALRCVHAIDDPRGCGFGPACETCGVRNTILKTIQSGKAFHRLEATILYGHTDGPIKIHVLVSTTPLRVSEEDFVLVCLEDITERKQAEERAARFNRALEGSLNEIYIFNAETMHFIEVNRGARENLGYSLEELRGLTPLDIKPEFTAESFAETIEPLRTGIKEKVRFTTVHCRKDGTQYPVEVHLQLVAGGSPVFVAIVLDITERKQAEEALRESEEKFRTLTVSSPVGMFLNDAQGKAIYVNEKCAELVGMPAEKALNFDWVSAVHPDDRERVAARWARAVQNCEEFHMEYRWAYADGRVVWTLGDIVPVRGGDGEVAVYIGTLTDITERKQAEEALRESEERYRSLVENINLGIAVIDPQMRVLSMNKQFLEWFPDLDLSTHPICYQAFSDPPREKPCSCCPVLKTFAGGLVHESVSETSVRGEIRNYRITSTPLRDTDGNVIAVIEVVEDITDKIKLEEELNKADKLESIGVLAGGIAHDFNNILTSLLGNI